VKLGVVCWEGGSIVVMACVGVVDQFYTCKAQWQLGVSS
jgi:hypothetical protein